MGKIPDALVTRNLMRLRTLMGVMHNEFINTDSTLNFKQSIMNFTQVIYIHISI